MFGANFYGESYYAQGPFVETPLILHTVTASFVLTAHLATKKLKKATVTASMVMGAFMRRQINKLLTVQMPILAFAIPEFIRALSLKHATTKLLTQYTEDIPLQAGRSTFGINLILTTTTTDTVA